MKRIIITGGQMGNKGAQAMTYVTLNEIAKRWPDVKPVVLDAPKKWDSNLKLDCIDVSLMLQCLMQIPVIRSIIPIFFPKGRLYHSILKDTVAIIDISGYAVGSNWTSKGLIAFVCTRLIAAHHYHVPVYLMPQSFGPFEFKGALGKIADILLKCYLPKADLIMCREEDGMEKLRKKYKLDGNLVLNTDIVLQCKGIAPENVFVNYPEPKKETVSTNAVAVIPNTKTIKNANKEKMLLTYKTIIAHLMKREKQVYLLFHSSEDQKFCRDVKAMFINDDNVHLVERELTCIEYSETVKQFDYIIASRYHSIVLAYRNGIPAIAIGWAIKYHELLKLFGQEEYLFDVRQEMRAGTIIETIDRINSNWMNEKSRIKTKLDEIQKKNAFDLVKLKAENC